jgi:hypothetical protein
VRKFSEQGNWAAVCLSENGLFGMEPRKKLQNAGSIADDGWIPAPDGETGKVELCWEFLVHSSCDCFTRRITARYTPPLFSQRIYTKVQHS